MLGKIYIQPSKKTLNQLFQALISETGNKITNALGSDDGVIGSVASKDTALIKNDIQKYNNAFDSLGLGLAWCYQFNKNDFQDSCLLYCYKKEYLTGQQKFQVFKAQKKEDQLRVFFIESDQNKLYDKTRFASNSNPVCFLLRIDGLGYVTLRFNTPFYMKAWLYDKVRQAISNSFTECCI